MLHRRMDAMKSVSIIFKENYLEIFNKKTGMNNKGGIWR